MKSITMALAAAAALLALQTGSASSQPNACSNNYVSCVESCVKKTTVTFQDRCIESCQMRNNECSEKIFGARPQPAPVTVAKQPREGGEAMARREAAPKQEASEAAPPQEAREEVPQQAPAAHPKVKVPAR